MLTTHPFNDDKLREECGIFGIWGAETASAMVALGVECAIHAFAVGKSRRVQHNEVEAFARRLAQPLQQISDSDNGFRQQNGLGLSRKHFTHARKVEYLAFHHVSFLQHTVRG